MPPGKPQKVCRDCLAEYTLALGEWEAKWLAEVDLAVDFGAWEVLNPRPKLPRRVADKPGPRCTTHWRKAHKQQRERAHETRTQRVFGLEPGEYGALLAYQGGTCAIPRCPAKGVVRRLAVDHNHATGGVRGLLCSPHNRLIGQSYDDPEVFEGIAEYLRNPPYERMRSDGKPEQDQPGEETPTPHDRHVEASG